MQLDSDAILELERSWLDRWIRGDPSRFLELCADDVRYFDSFLGRWIDGIGALRDHLEGLRGKILLDRYELESPRVVAAGEAMLATFVWIGHDGESRSRWCAADSYRQTGDRAQICQSIWASIRQAS